MVQAVAAERFALPLVIPPQSPSMLVDLTRSQKLRIDATADGYVNQQTIFKE